MKQEFHIEGMSCENCSKNVANTISELAGVKGVNVQLKHKKAKVKFDESKVSVDEIMNKVNNDTVYQASIA